MLRVTLPLARDDRRPPTALGVNDENVSWYRLRHGRRGLFEQLRHDRKRNGDVHDLWRGLHRARDPGERRRGRLDDQVRAVPRDVPRHQGGRRRSRARRDAARVEAVQQPPPRRQEDRRLPVAAREGLHARQLPHRAGRRGDDARRRRDRSRQDPDGDERIRPLCRGHGDQGGRDEEVQVGLQAQHALRSAARATSRARRRTERSSRTAAPIQSSSRRTATTSITTTSRRRRRRSASTTSPRPT